MKNAHTNSASPRRFSFLQSFCVTEGSYFSRETVSKDVLLVCFRDRLSASDMLQVRKVIEHVYEKVMGQGSDSGSQTAGGPGTSTTSQEKSETEKDEDLASIAEEKVELLCNEQVRFNINVANAQKILLDLHKVE